MYGISRSSKLPLKAALVVWVFLVGEELSWLGRKHMDWVASVLCSGVNSSSLVKPIRLLTLCARLGGFGGHSGFWVFNLILTLAGSRNIRHTHCEPPQKWKFIGITLWHDMHHVIMWHGQEHDAVLALTYCSDSLSVSFSPKPRGRWRYLTSLLTFRVQTQVIFQAFGAHWWRWVQVVVRVLLLQFR